MLLIQCHSVSLTPNASSSSSSASCSDQNPSSSSYLLSFSPKSLSFSPLPFDLRCRRGRCRRGTMLLRSCKASLGNGSSWPAWGEGEDDADQFLPAVFLASETVQHYNLLKIGFIEKPKWHAPHQGYPFSVKTKAGTADVSFIGHGLLRRFQSPTIFLKIACNGDLLLPIIVGEVAISQLIKALNVDLHKGCPDQFQFVKNTVETLGYEVKMIRITERVANTYFARIYLGKPEVNASISIDSRPSDAINVAERFKAPIYVSKEIVAKDAIKIVYGTWRGSGKTVYDVSLDSATEGPDPLSEEIDVVQKMNTAVLEERYEDAAMWRDKLKKLRVPRHQP